MPALAAASLAAAGAIAVVTIQRQAPAEAPPQGCVIPPPPGIGGPFALTAGDGSTVTEASFRGQPTLIYFGFTHCPDVCPTSMYLLEQALETMNTRERAQFRTVLVTVDPERDDPATMAAYAATEGFPPGLIGLTGEPDAVRQVLQSYGVTAIRDPLEDGAYNVSHTSFLYVLDREANVAGMVTTLGKTPEEIASCVRQSLDQ